MPRKRRRQFGEVDEIPSRVQGRDPRYRARYTGPDGGRYKAPETFATIGDADAWLRSVRRRIDAGNWIRPDADGKTPSLAMPTLAAYAEQRITARQNRPVKPLRETTAVTYRRCFRLELADTLGSHPLDLITEADVTAWHETSSAKGHPTQTANAYLFLVSLFNDAVRANLVDANPCKVEGARGKPEPKHKAETLTVAELRTYLAAVPDRYRLPLMVAAYCALRSGEVRGLRARDVDPSSGRIRVEQGVSRVKGEFIVGPPKTAAGKRTVYAPAVLRQALADVVADRDPDALLFPATDGETPMGQVPLWEAHKRGRDAIGRPTLTVHDLRKTAATLAAQQGATVRELMAMLGHTTPTVAMIYQSAADERMRAIAERMDAALGEQT